MSRPHRKVLYSSLRRASLLLGGIFVDNAKANLLGILSLRLLNDANHAHTQVQHSSRMHIASCDLMWLQWSWLCLEHFRHYSSVCIFAPKMHHWSITKVPLLLCRSKSAGFCSIVIFGQIVCWAAWAVQALGEQEMLHQRAGQCLRENPFQLGDRRADGWYFHGFSGPESKKEKRVPGHDRFNFNGRRQTQRRTYTVGHFRKRSVMLSKPFKTIIENLRCV